MRASRGFTLIELLVSATIAMAVVGAALVALGAMNEVAARQAAANDLVAAGRVAMEAMARDVRGAGDSVGLLPAPCLGAAAHPTSTTACPAILDAHPWRIAVARNAWQDANGDGSTFSRDDALPPAGRAFGAEPENVVAYRFVPDEGFEAPLPRHADAGGERRIVLGRIERVVNPFRFPAGTGAERVTVLVEHAVLDDRMSMDPSDPGAADGRTAHALFGYRVLTRAGELAGDPAIVGRDTEGRRFLTPPLRFFETAVPDPYLVAPPWVPSSYEQELVGLRADGATVPQLLAAGSQGLDPAVPTSDLRFVLDHDRIRAVRIAFKVVERRERKGVVGGLDLDGDPANGTAQLHAFETTVELKVLAGSGG